ncbi:unnamed protein product [Polarella glacialis]|uniref:Profilin n=1 Tax=Polarella glacialis TaxID=89957 RepID=A0A813FYI6_POLGL|nr:unnamed protein product [Polarella glacialis]CAE8617629.1 unnamed protein product [Polarella glacialis]CAE8713635.1 unnamed protein product [Polarella glacialis]|mmetsp:Transcript_60977/g.98732  ORF Transcript_60977/g.98732 Transcript_60977/m.98732 type:complete len:168 (-) Transcript_60977:76-579(-)
MAEEANWDNTLEEWLITEGFCCAAGLAQGADGMFYAAAPAAEEAGWGIIFKDDHEEDIMQDDDSTKKVTINEPSALKQVAETGSAPASGLWLGGHKYRVVQKDMAFESGEHTFAWILGAMPKKGVHIVRTPNGQIIAALYDEEKSQTSGNCKRVVLAFAEYLAGMGY